MADKISKNEWYINQILNTQAGNQLRGKIKSTIGSHQGDILDVAYDAQCSFCKKEYKLDFDPTLPLNEITMKCDVCDKLLYTSQIYVHEN
ncbi:MAG: hypothetical protein ACTSQF_01950 [Candidatus Heimdallarchaeaceae archaeon]